MRESPIFVKTFDLLKWILGRTEKFPKSQRFFAAKRINDTLFEFYEFLIEAVVKKDGNLKLTLSNADAELTKLRHYIRLAMELRYVSIHQYEFAVKQIDEIGKLLGGWMKKSGTGST